MEDRCEQKDTLLAAVKHVDDMLAKADGHAGMRHYPWWHGWALREAFLKGAEYARSVDKPGKAAPS